MEIFSVVGSILIDDEQADETIDKSEKKAKSLSETFTEMTSAAGKIGAGILAGATVAGGALMGLVNNTAETAKMIDKFSQVAGFTTKGFQEWDYVMKSVGYTMEDASGDMAALAEKTLEAATGAGEGAEWFGMLGIKATGAGGQLKSQEVVFGEVITKLQGMEDITKRNAIATALMGTTGEELGPILNMTGTELESMKNKANELGVVMSDKALKANLEYSRTVADLKTQFSGVWMQLSTDLLPVFQDLFTWITTHMPQIKNEIKFAMEKASEVILFVRDNSKELIIVVGIMGGAWVAHKGFVIASTVATEAMTIALGVQKVAVAASTAVIWLFNIALSSNPIGAAILALSALGLAIVAIIKNWDKIIEVIKKAWDWLTRWNGTAAKDKHITVTTTYKETSSAKTIDERLGNTKVSKNARGTDYWTGGKTWVNEEGGEIMNLPRGTQIIPHDVSMAMATNKGNGGLVINVINHGTLVGSNGMKELSDMVSVEVANAFGLSTGGTY